MERALTREAILARRRRLRRKYRDLYDRLTRLLFEHDPMHVAALLDEYEPEVERILPKLAACRSRAELTELIHDVFREMFSPEMAGARDRYEPIARDIWKIAKAKEVVSA